MVLSSNQRQRKTKKPESEYDLGDDDDDDDDATYNDVDDSTFNQPMAGSPSYKHGLAGSVGLPGESLELIRRPTIVKTQTNIFITVVYTFGIICGCLDVEKRRESR